MQPFAKKDSIVRTIWGKSDTVLFIFAGAAAEFALNKAVDWLYFTGKLPSDPLGRLFSTVTYAKRIVFSPMDEANASIDIIRNIHDRVEQNRGATIPDWAYRDVLFMLIHYSIASYELLERKLTDDEKEEVYNVFYRVGQRMGLAALPSTYIEWLPVREAHLKENLQRSEYTFHLFTQYKKTPETHKIPAFDRRTKILVPKQVKELLHFSDFSLLTLVIPLYKISRHIKMDRLFKNILLPSEYKTQINELDIVTT